MKRHIPNAITCCNLMSGCVAIFFAFCGQFTAALAAIIAGAVFDFFDGMTARLLGVSSPIGLELDSLADVVTFGVAPSMMLFNLMHECSVVSLARSIGAPGSNSWMLLVLYVPFLAFLMAASSALRLAKFNLDTRQKMGFIGLPTPANALFWGSFIVAWGKQLLVFPSILPILLVMMLLSCYLLVSEIPMFALKFKTWGWKGNEVRWLFLLSCVPLVAVLRWGSLAVIVAWYVLLSILTQKHAA